MKKKLLALTSLILALMLVFTACGGNSGEYDEDDEDEDDETTSTTAPQGTEGTEPTEPESNEPQFTNVNISNRLVQLYATKNSVFSYAGGLCYADPDTKLSGILSHDGTFDSGAVYAAVSSQDDYFMYMTEKPSDPADINKMNTIGLVDGNGKVLVPAEYAYIKDISNNGRYYKVIKVTGQTTDESQTLLTFRKSYFEPEAAADCYYAGTWYVYDIQEGKLVPNATGTKAYSVDVYDNTVTFTADDGTKKCINTLGQEYPADATILASGNYFQASTKAVYDALGAKLFDYDNSKFNNISHNADTGYYTCSGYIGGKSQYQVLDATGAVVVSGLDKYPYVYANNLMIYKDMLCDFAGNYILQEDVDSVARCGDFWYVRNYDTKQFYLLNDAMEVVFSGNENEGYDFISSDCILEQETANGTFYYNFATKTFSIQGTLLDAGLVSVKTGTGTYDLVDTLTGEVLASGFSRYSISEDAKGNIYVLASKSGEGMANFKLN